MTPENLFDTYDPVIEDQDEDSTSRDEKNNTGGTAAKKTIKTLPPFI